MAELETVIKVLEFHKNRAFCDGCLYNTDAYMIYSECPIFDDAIELLKKQEPVKAQMHKHDHLVFFRCGSCGLKIDPGINYCPMCGKAVKWDG